MTKPAANLGDGRFRLTGSPFRHAKLAQSESFGEILPSDVGRRFGTTRPKAMLQMSTADRSWLAADISYDSPH